MADIAGWGMALRMCAAALSRTLRRRDISREARAEARVALTAARETLGIGPVRPPSAFLPLGSEDRQGGGHVRPA